MLNLGILGVWHVHTDDYAQQTLKSGLAALKTVWDADEQAGRACADKYGLTFIKDLDAFLTDPAIDAVICCSPTTFHQTALVKAARAGKHIFTEKLLADTSAQAEVIEQAVQQAGIRCAVSMPLLSSAWYQYVKQMVNNGRLGRVTGARMRRSHSGVSDKWLPARWYDVSLSGGGAMMDLGAHPVYVLADLFGKPARVTGLMNNLYGTSSDENAIITVEFANGVLATCETAFVTYGVPDILEVYGTEGSVFVRDGEVSLLTRSMAEAGLRAARPAQLPQELPSPLIRFITACIEGHPMPEELTPKAAAVMTRIIEAGYLADSNGKTVII